MRCFIEMALFSLSLPLSLPLVCALVRPVLANRIDARVRVPIQQILRHCKTIEIPDEHYEKSGRHHDTELMGIAGPIIIYTNICWLVYD